MYSSPVSIGELKSRRKRWKGYVARIRETRVVHRVVLEKPGERNHLETPGVNGRIY